MKKKITLIGILLLMLGSFQAFGAYPAWYHAFSLKPQVPTILPFGPITEDAIFKKDVYIEGTLYASFNLAINPAGATGETGLYLYSIADAGGNPTYSILAQSDAEGIANKSDLRIGLDESTKNLIICDRGDITENTPVITSTQPTLCILNSAITGYAYLNNTALHFIGDNSSIAYDDGVLTHRSHKAHIFVVKNDLVEGNTYTFNSEANIELTDDNAEQAWMYLEPKINQTGTANYIGLLMDVTETAVVGTDDALMDLRVATNSKFKVAQNADSIGGQVESGSIITESYYDAALADDGSFNLLDNANGGWGFVMAGDGEEYGHFTFTSAGVVTLGDVSANVVNTDTDAKLCIFDGGTVVTIRNRLAAAKAIKVVFHYVED